MNKLNNMRMWKLFLISIIISFSMPVPGQVVDDLNVSFVKAGKIKPRHAKEIESSNWSIGAETMDRDYSVYANWKQYLGPLGAKKGRIQSGWGKTEKEKGKYSWEWLDEIVLDMVDQGVEPWMQVSYGNTIYEGGGGIYLGDGIPESQEALEAWGNYVAALVNRYKQHVDEWEIWNEPNYHIDFNKYADFLIMTAEIIKKTQPDSKVLAFALGSGVNYEFADKVLKIVSDKGKIGLIDQVTHHRNISIPEDNKNEIELDKVLLKYSDKIVARQGEAGFPSTYSEGAALAKQKWNEMQQVKSNLRRMMCDLGRGKECSVFTIVDLKYMTPTKTFMNTKGLIEADENLQVKRLKPSYFGVQNVCSVFDNTLVKNNDLKCEVNSDKIYHFEYKNKVNNKSLIVYWEGGAIPLAENSFKTTSLRLTGASVSKPVLADLRTGNVYFIPKKNIIGKKGEIIIKDVILYDSPVIITDLSLIKLEKN
jgi:hypothetical protein